MSDQFITSLSRQLLEIVTAEELLIQQLDFTKSSVKDTLLIEPSVQSTARRVRLARLALEDDQNEAVLSGTVRKK